MTRATPRAIALLALLSLAALAAGCGGKPSPRPHDPTGGGAAAAPDAGAAGPAELAGAPWEQSGIDWSRPPEPGAEPEFQVPAPTRAKLSNGVQVLVVESHELPIVSIHLVNPRAGALYDPRGKAGLASLTADLMDEGAGKWSALAIADELQRLGADLGVRASDDGAVVSMSTLSKTLDDSLALFAAVVTAPAFAQADFDRVKSDTLSELTQRRDQPRAVASLAFRQAVFGAGKPYGSPVAGHLDTVGKLTRRDVQRFYADHWSPSAITVVVVGDVTASGATASLERALGGWKARDRAGKRPAVRPAADPPRLVLVDKPGAAQSVVLYGRPALARSDERYFVAEVVNTVLGGSFTSRLNYRLREELGYTYGAGSGFDYGHDTGVWRASTALFTDKTLAGIRELLAIAGGVARQPIPADELARGKQLLVRGFPQMFDTNAAIAGAYADLARYGLPDDWYGKLVPAVAAVTAEDAQAFAAQALEPDGMVLVVVADLDKLRDELLALGLRPAVELDRDGKLVKRY